MIHPSDEQLNDYVEQALSPADHVTLARHVEGCSDCAQVVADLQDLVQKARSMATLMPPPELWSRIESRLPSESAALKPAPQHDRSPIGWQLPFSPGWVLATAALVIAAFLTGRLVEQRTARPAQVATERAPDADAARAANLRERVLLVAVGDHLERSQMVLVGLANAHTRDALDISVEQQAADELLASNRLLRQTAAQTGETNVGDVLDELERVLAEVANAPSHLSTGELAAIQQRIEAQGILFKVKVIGLDIRERENSTSAGRPQPVS
jgi:hypothetical protein